MFHCMRNPPLARVMFQKECLAWHLKLARRLRTALAPSFERISRDVLGHHYVYGWGARVCSEWVQTIWVWLVQARGEA